MKNFLIKLVVAFLLLVSLATFFSNNVVAQGTHDCGFRGSLGCLPTNTTGCDASFIPNYAYCDQFDDDQSLCDSQTGVSCITACQSENQSCTGPSGAQANCCSGLTCHAVSGGFFCQDIDCNDVGGTCATFQFGRCPDLYEEEPLGQYSCPARQQCCKRKELTGASCGDGGTCVQGSGNVSTCPDGMAPVPASANECVLGEICCAPLPPGCKTKGPLPCEEGYQQCLPNAGTICCTDLNMCPEEDQTIITTSINPTIYCDSSGNATTNPTGRLYTAIGCIPIGDVNEFLGFILPLALGIAGGIALILIVYAGFLIITSAGNPQKLQAGRELLTAAVMGLLLLIFSAFILQFVGVTILRIPGF